MLFADVGSPPRKGEVGPEYYETLLRANFFQLGTGGATLGMDRDAGMIALVRRLSTASLDANALFSAIEQFVDFAEAWTRRLAELGPASPHEARGTPFPAIRASAEMAELQHDLETLLFARVYRHADVLAQRARAGEALRAMFRKLAAEPDLIPERFRAAAAEDGPERAAADYLACMTDRYALELYARGGWDKS